MKNKPSKTVDNQILHRLKIARGHMDKVIEMVESNSYCIDIIHQSQAVQSALLKTDHILLEKHLGSCVVEHMQRGEIEESIKEIMKVIRKV